MTSKFNEVDGELVRPYARTSGRTRPCLPVSPAALLSTTVPERDAPASLLLPERDQIVKACGTPRTITELAQHLCLPEAVVRVVVGDLAEEGWLQVVSLAGDSPTPDGIPRR